MSLALAACSGAGASADSTVSPQTSVTTSTTIQTSTTSAQPGTTTSSLAPSTTTTVPVELGGELVFNGDFDFGDGVPSGWQFIVEGEGQVVEYVTEGTGHHISFFAPVVEDVPWPEARLAQPFDVEPHRDYVLSVEARSVTQGRLFLALIFLEEDGDEILLRGPGEPEVTSSDWESIEATLESPVRAAQAFVIMRLAIRPDLSDADTLSVDVNSVSVREVLD